MHRNCFVLISHKIDESILKYMSFLRHEANDIMDFVVLYDCASSEIKAGDYPEFTFQFFNSKELKGFYHCGNKLLPCPLVSLLDMIKKRRYDHYLLMENDIVFTGNFKSFLMSIDKVECDYMHIATDILKGPEQHWPILYIRNSPFEDIRFSWCQMYYASYQFLTDVDAFMKENNTFFFEFLLPTFAYNKGYSIRQFENYGYNFQVSWGPSEIYEYKYLHERMPNTFYHPIKNLSIVDYQQDG